MPTADDARTAANLAAVSGVVAFQADACASSGSPLYGRVLAAVTGDLVERGVCAAVLTGRSEDPFGSALALRFLAAVHRLVLEGRAPDLAAFYPSAGGTDPSDPGPAFLRTVRAHQAEVAQRTGEPVQTNEVGRSAALVGGFAAVARRTGLPLRVLEVGASAGLNLRWDRFAYVTPDGVAGDDCSELRFADVWEGQPPWLPLSFDVAERAGCDLHPIDATTPAGRLTLRSFVWPDQLDRLQRLEGAIEVARRWPVPVDRAGAADWVASRLASPAPGLATVVVHSIVFQYLAPADQRRFVSSLAAAGQRASAKAPLAWLRMEPGGARAEIRLTTWPGGDERLLGTAGYHGQPIWWASGS